MEGLLVASARQTCWSFAELPFRIRSLVLRIADAGSSPRNPSILLNLPLASLPAAPLRKTPDA
jgi:hypothetical protein